jgi:hypothetical protein
MRHGGALPDEVELGRQLPREGGDQLRGVGTSSSWHISTGECM